MSQTPSLNSIHRLVWIALMAALTAVGGIISVPIPFSPVPVTLQTMFVLLAGLILGPRGGMAAVLLYMAAGCLGLPIFAGGKAGLAVFLGPTGGFLLGFLPGAALCGLAAASPPRPFALVLAICAASTALTLLLGSMQLSMLMDISFAKALALGALPFLPGGAAKCLAAAAVHRFLTARRLAPAC